MTTLNFVLSPSKNDKCISMPYLTYKTVILTPGSNLLATELPYVILKNKAEI